MSYNILSLDGGGTWALIQVKCLQRLFGEDARGHSVLSHFDLVAGNSGGSLVLAALAENLSLSDTLKLFVDEDSRKRIFTRHYSVWSPFYSILGLGPKYSTSGKLEGLAHFLPNIAKVPLSELPQFVSINGQSKTHFFIPTFDYNRQRALFFRSNLNSNGISEVLAKNLNIDGSGSSPNASLLEAANASSTAPINYFNSPAKVAVCDSYYWDGAVAGYNNPVLAATVEAVINHIPINDICILSIGTGITTLPAGAQNHSFAHKKLQLKISNKQGLINDVKKISKSILSAPPDAASYIAYTFLDPSHATANLKIPRFIRANPQNQPILTGDRWDLPSQMTLEMFTRISSLDMDATRQVEVRLIEEFCELWLRDEIPNQPIRLDANLRCLIGQSRFSEVKKMFLEQIK
jgi:uncharacterized protein